MKVVIVCGSRSGKLSSKQRDRLEEHLKGVDILIHGNATGIDQEVDDFANFMGIQRVKVPAAWKLPSGGVSKKAGPRRNRLMARLAIMITRGQTTMFESPITCIAFPGGVGTDDMKSVAKENRFKLIEEQ